jgi:hypothetical protein
MKLSNEGKTEGKAMKRIESVSQTGNPLKAEYKIGC